MEASKSFFDLFVWKKAHEFVLCVYRVCSKFPDFEQFGLRSQFTRAAVSIPSNIAEGQGRESSKEFVRFLSVARGSLRELSTQLEICERLHYVNNSVTLLSRALITEVDKMITSLATKLKTDN